MHQTCTGTKNTKTTKFSRNYMGPLPLLSSCWKICFFVFFGACRCLVHLMVCFFCFFGACQCVCISHVKIMMKKVRVTRVLDPPSA